MKIRAEIHVIYLFIDIITEIDVLLSLAHFSKTIGTVKPEFGYETEVIDGVHPLLDCSYKPRQVIPNSFVSKTCDFTHSRFKLVFSFTEKQHRIQFLHCHRQQHVWQDNLHQNDRHLANSRSNGMLGSSSYRQISRG